MASRFQREDIISRPSCPFCGGLIERPKELAARMPHEMPVGACSCGAVFACDVTGHNLGTAMIEALVFGCNGDWDLAWGLLPEDDYLEKTVENYDFEKHLIVHGGVYGGRRIAGVLYFIRMHQDIREVTEEGGRRLLEKATSSSPGLPRKRGGKTSFDKKEVEDLVRAYRLEPLLIMADQDRRIIRHMQRLLYSVDKPLRWRAAEALGMVSARVALDDPGAISRLLQGLFTALSDTAASSWGALDAIGEIIGSSPEQFAGYIPQLYQLSRDRRLLAGILRALANIAAKRPDTIRRYAFRFIPILKDPDPEIRGYTVILLGHLAAREAREDLTGLLDDQEVIEIYRDGDIEARILGDLATEALERL